METTNRPSIDGLAWQLMKLYVDLDTGTTICGNSCFANDDELSDPEVEVVDDFVSEDGCLGDRGARRR